MEPELEPPEWLEGKRRERKEGEEPEEGLTGATVRREVEEDATPPPVVLVWTEPSL
tara:strand:- start:34 stop:201 length:168 start_codon:yes stop_codon:yes gene_type:complete